MEKRNRKAGHSYSLRDRILAQIMVIIVTLTMIPFDSLVAHAATTTNVKSIGSIQTEYEVDYGTSKDDIGLPSELSVILETVTSPEDATNGGTNEYSEDTVEKSVSWEGDYDGDTAGTYALTAEFDDSSLYYDDMPTVYVTVKEPETTAEEPAAEEPAAEEPAADEPANEEDKETEEEAVTDEASKEEAAKEEAAPKKKAAPKEAQKYTPTGREQSDLNVFGQQGNMTVTVTKVNGDPLDGPLKKGDEFKLTLEFWETAEGIQFDMNQLTYTLPDGCISMVPQHGTSDVDLLTAEGDLITLTSPFEVDSTTIPNTITYTWNQEGDENNTYERIAAAEKVRLKIVTYMYVNDEGVKFEFEDGTEIPVDLSVKITVIKSVTINGHTLTEAEKAQMVFAIFEGDGSTGVRAKDADGNVIPTFTYAEMTQQSSTQAKKEFSGLVKGTYTVKEISGLDIQDYTFSASSVTQATEDIPASDERTFNLTNIYVQDSGSLVLKKNFASGSALNGSNMTTAQRQAITFTVTGPGGFNHVYTYDQIHSAGGALTLNDLPVGTYHVMEASNIPGYECTSTSYDVKVDGTATGSGDNNASVDVVNGKESEVTYTNNYRQRSGSLKLTKEFEGDALTDALKNQITFTITGPNGYSRTVTYAEIASGSITITDLPIGTYTIKENRGNIPTGVLAQTYINGSGTASTNLQTTASVTDGGTAQTTYKNKYTKVGSLKIIKKVKGDVSYSTFIGKKFTLTLTKPDGSTQTITLNSTNFGSSRGTYQINNLPIGNYTIQEGNANIADYTRTTTYDGSVSGTGTPSSGTSTVIAQSPDRFVCSTIFSFS